MKPNSCLYKAVCSLVLYQFDLDISERLCIFDKYNTGEGIAIADMCSVIDEALSPYGLLVNAVYGNISGTFSHQHLCLSEKFVPAPCVAFIAQHAVVILPGETITGNMGVTITRMEKEVR